MKRFMSFILVWSSAGAATIAYLDNRMITASVLVGMMITSAIDYARDK